MYTYNSGVTCMLHTDRWTDEQIDTLDVLIMVHAYVTGEKLWLDRTRTQGLSLTVRTLYR